MALRERKPKALHSKVKPRPISVVYNSKLAELKSDIKQLTARRDNTTEVLQRISERTDAVEREVYDLMLQCKIDNRAALSHVLQQTSEKQFEDSQAFIQGVVARIYKDEGLFEEAEPRTADLERLLAKLEEDVITESTKLMNPIIEALDRQDRRVEEMVSSVYATMGELKQKLSKKF